MSKIQDLDRVKLTEELQGTQFETGYPITLSSGTIGTVVMEYDGTAFEVEFVDNQGMTYAIETIPVEKLKFFERPSLKKIELDYFRSFIAVVWFHLALLHR